MKYSEKFAHDFNRFVVIGAATKRRFFFSLRAVGQIDSCGHALTFYSLFKPGILTPSRPNECSGLLQILLCLTPDDFTRQWGTSWTGEG